MIKLCIFVVFRQVTQLLVDVICFVAEQENTGQDPLEITVSKPDRERQKLLREQNILKQVSTIKTTPGNKIYLVTLKTTPWSYLLIDLETNTMWKFLWK